MASNETSLINNETKKALEGLIVDGSRKTGIDIDNIANEIVSKGSFYDLTARHDRPVVDCESVLSKKTMNLSDYERRMVRKALIARFALHLVSSIDKFDLPDSVLELYPQVFERLSKYLTGDESAVHYDVNDDFYSKDMHFVLGISIPCGAQSVDIDSRVSPLTVALSIIRSKRIDATLPRYLACKGWGPWLRIHTDTRYLEDFNEKGWNQCYIRIADLLEKNLKARGMIGTAWFYDPLLLNISPKLAYLQIHPIAGGAFRLKHGVNDIDIARATAKSAKRKMLYDQGRYRPRAYSLLWVRDSMMAWADKNRKLIQKKDDV